MEMEMDVLTVMGAFSEDFMMIALPAPTAGQTGHGLVRMRRAWLGGEGIQYTFEEKQGDRSYEGQRTSDTLASRDTKAMFCSPFHGRIPA